MYILEQEKVFGDDRLEFEKDTIYNIEVNQKTYTGYYLATIFNPKYSRIEIKFLVDVCDGKTLDDDFVLTLKHDLSESTYFEEVVL